MAAARARISAIAPVANAKIKEQAELLQAVIDSSINPIFIKDSNGRYMLVNGPAADALGSTKANVIGKSDSDFFGADVASVLTANDAAVMAGGEIQIFEESVTRNGDVRHFVSTKSVLKIGGVISGIIGMAHDVTERKAAEVALAELNDQLELRVTERTREFEASQLQVLQMQKLDALGQLTSGIAHDFNNILAAIMSGFDLIERKIDDEYVGMIAKHCREAAARGAKIVKQMMAFARQEILTPISVDLETLVREMEPLLRQAIPGNTIVCDFPAGLPNVLIDAALFEGALINLAGNANDAMPGGGILSLSAHVSMAGEAGRPIELGERTAVVFRVHDTGFGMTPDVLAKIVEPFFTTKDVGKGTGLGLAMVQGFITQSGGALRIESAVGNGTTVLLYLPCNASLGGADEVMPPVLQPAKKGRGSILLVDDDPNLRPIVAVQLHAMGYLVTEAADRETALRHIDAKTPFDLLLTDVVMAGGDGIMLAAEVRQRRPDLPVLFMTGRAESKRLIGETVVYKPFDSNELSNKIFAMLANKVSMLAKG